MNAKYSALQIADFFIQLVNSLPDDSIDNMKLNKLLYYVQGFSLVELGYPLFADDIEAWDYGPVIPKVYQMFRNYGKDDILAPVVGFEESDMNSEELSLLVDVYSRFGKYSGIELKEMTHEKGSPWEQVYENGANNLISVPLLQTYFENTIKIPRFEIDYDKASIITEVPCAWDTEEDGVYDE